MIRTANSEIIDKSLSACDCKDYEPDEKDISKGGL